MSTTVRAKQTGQNFIAKKEAVAEITRHLESAKSAIFVDYRGITVAEVNDLRNKFREAGVVFKVYKNNLARIALNNFGVTALDNDLTGTLAVAFSYNEETTAAQIIKKAKFKDKMAFKFGVIGNEVLDAAAVTKIASIPSKEQLIAQLLGLLQSGARNMAYVIKTGHGVQ